MSCIQIQSPFRPCCQRVRSSQWLSSPSSYTLTPAAGSFPLGSSLSCQLSSHFFISPLGLDGVGGKRHHQLQATSHPAAGHPCQPVWLSHREGRGQDKGNQRGERPESKSTPSSPSLLHRLFENLNMKNKSPPGDEGKSAAGRGEIFHFP